MLNNVNIYSNKKNSASSHLSATPIKHEFSVKNKKNINNTPNFGTSQLKYPILQETISTHNTRLRNKEEVQKYQLVLQNCDTNCKKILPKLLKTGILLSNNTDDKSTMLDNLYNICSEPRITGLNAQGILKETLTTIDNPYLITQKFGNIPNKIVDAVISQENNTVLLEAKQNQAQGKPITSGFIKKGDLDVISSSCVAASIEFNLANKQPAEFVRMVSEITSPKHTITKTIKTANISENILEAIWLLDEFNVNYKTKSLDEVTVNISPDRNAIIRARIQTVDKDPGERSVIDVLLQSTFMNVGSQKTYNSLTDMRTGKYNPDPKGLTDIEKNLAEVLATGKRKISVTYQNLNDEGKIIGYECDFNTMKQQITDALKMGENVIIGYTYTDSNKVVQGGHEITIIGIEKDKKGKEYFVCNDTDDDKSTPIYHQVESFLPQIHHAGLPREALKEDVEFVQNWQEMLNEYKQFNQQKA